MRVPVTFYAGFAMLYDMQSAPVSCSLVLLALLFAGGCVSEQPVSPVSVPEPLPTALPTPESLSASVPASEMALQPADLPSEYILRDRSVMITPEVSQLSRDLGWQQGYFVMFDRTGRTRSDQTRVRQAINIFPSGNIKKVYTLEKLAVKGGESMMPSPNEIPFPEIRDQSIALRMTDTPEPGQVTYTVIFTRKNVFEQVTVSGTSTDYEMVKDIVQKAVAKIR